MTNRLFDVSQRQTNVTGLFDASQRQTYVK